MRMLRPSFAWGWQLWIHHNRAVSTITDINPAECENVD
jgi:hypothetical protein